jgi:hypothetical protein
MSWIRVSNKKRCPVCNHPDWCSVSEDGAVAICMREPSDKECKSGGWIHVLDSSIGARICKLFTRKEPKIPPKEWHNKVLGYCHLMTELHWQVIHENLGLSPYSIGRYLIGYYPHHIPAFTFPLWTGSGRLCGVRIRAANGDKWSVKGSQNGLHIPNGLTGEDPLLICEGCTDPITATEMGFDVISRTSCNTGFQDIMIFLKKHTYSQVVIVSDNDLPKKRNDGSFWYPGQESADKLCKQLTKNWNVKVIKPPVNDLRLWYNQGAKREDVLDLIKGV